MLLRASRGERVPSHAAPPAAAAASNALHASPVRRAPSSEGTARLLKTSCGHALALRALRQLGLRVHRDREPDQLHQGQVVERIGVEETVLQVHAKTACDAPPGRRLAAPEAGLADDGAGERATLHLQLRAAHLVDAQAPRHRPRLELRGRGHHHDLVTEAAVLGDQPARLAVDVGLDMALADALGEGFGVGERGTGEIRAGLADQALEADARAAVLDVVETLARELARREQPAARLFEHQRCHRVAGDQGAVEIEERDATGARRQLAQQPQVLLERPGRGHGKSSARCLQDGAASDVPWKNTANPGVSGRCAHRDGAPRFSAVRRHSPPARTTAACRRLPH